MPRISSVYMYVLFFGEKGTHSGGEMLSGNGSLRRGTSGGVVMAA